mgnify:CR=1 FL=1
MELDPDINDPRGWKPVVDCMQIRSLLFHRPPQPFIEDIIQISAAPTHRDVDLSLGQSLDPTSTCILAALVRIHNFWPAVFEIACSNALTQKPASSVSTAA